mmetsp:Transcript_23532/g.72899  ORF Transcript_23532/g.72899 Transcript_23532/m.72899 type:complete len:211 (-) Transcript_23532:3-635(-)
MRRGRGRRRRRWTTRARSPPRTTTAPGRRCPRSRRKGARRQRTRCRCSGRGRIRRRAARARRRHRTRPPTAAPAIDSGCPRGRHSPRTPREPKADAAVRGEGCRRWPRRRTGVWRKVHHWMARARRSRRGGAPRAVPSPLGGGREGAAAARRPKPRHPESSQRSRRRADAPGRMNRRRTCRCQRRATRAPSRGRAGRAGPRCGSARPSGS